MNGTSLKAHTDKHTLYGRLLAEPEQLEKANEIILKMKQLRFASFNRRFVYL
jgi:hypothetical protein